MTSRFTWMRARSALVGGGILATALVAPAALVSYDFTGPGLGVPDGNPVGASLTEILNLPAGSLTGVSVRLDIAGGFNGDLYVQLNHGGAFAVLLNRPGRTEQVPGGYGDPGLTVTLADTAPAGDIHRYRLNLPGGEAGRLPVPLTGMWQPDGRTKDPASVVLGDSRPAVLASFQALDAGGAWTLFLCDLDPGGLSHLNGWGLDLEYAAVPEPAGWATVVGLGSIAFAVGRAKLRHRRSRAHSA